MSNLEEKCERTVHINNELPEEMINEFSSWFVSDVHKNGYWTTIGNGQ